MLCFMKQLISDCEEIRFYPHGLMLPFNEASSSQTIIIPVWWGPSVAPKAICQSLSRRRCQFSFGRNSSTPMRSVSRTLFGGASSARTCGEARRLAPLCGSHPRSARGSQMEGG